MDKPSILPTLQFDEMPSRPDQLRQTSTLQFDEVVTEVKFAPVSIDSFISERPVMATSKTHLVTSEAWTWEQLRDYVVSSIQSVRGAFPRNPVKEASIFKSFANRWGDKAEAIARTAVEVHQCWWKSAPLSVERFCLGSDPYFAEVIAASL